MADTTTATDPTTDKGLVPAHTVDEPVGDLQLPRGWMYKSWKIGPWRTPWYASPRFQLGMVSFVCFMCPGMFNALSGLGGGGKSDPQLADQMVLFIFDGGRIGQQWTNRSCDRTSPCIVSSLESVSWLARSLIGSGSDCPSPSVESDIAFMRSVFSSRCINMFRGSTSSLVLCWVPVRVSCGRLRELS
jgi:hypothetical protein